MPSHSETGPAITLLPFEVLDFGLEEYTTVWEQQTDAIQKRLAGEQPDTLFIGEHLPVITLGRGSHPDNLLSPHVPVIPIERGGDVTYHGPGQLIAYPIFLLPEGRRDLHRYLRDLEEVIILTLKAYGVEGVRNPGWTGVWVYDTNPKSPDALRKIASIGVAVRKWVTYHGLALNVETNLSHFEQLNPCGLQSQVMTSLAQILKEETPSMATVKATMIQQFKQVFGTGRETP